LRSAGGLNHPKATVATRGRSPVSSYLLPRRKNQAADRSLSAEYFITSAPRRNIYGIFHKAPPMA
jgi:hypothetical protein